MLHSPKLQHYWNLTIRLFSVISRTLIGGSYPSAEMQLVYSTALDNWTNTQRNVQCSLIWELMPYEFKLGHNAVKATKNICCAKGERSVDHKTITCRLKKFCSGCKNLDNQARLGRPKTIDSELVLQAKETNQASSTCRVSGKLGILQSSVVCRLYELGKGIKSYQIVPHITKILQNF